MSRNAYRLRWVIFARVFLALAVSFDRFGGSVVRDFALRRNAAGRDAKQYHGNTYTIVKVIDGDTLDIDIPDGDLEYTRIRLLGIDTPETKDARYDVMHYGPQAEEFTRSLCENQAVSILIDTQSPARDKYNRLLCYVVFEDSTVLNELLIERGYGYADLRFAHSRYKKFVSLMESAARNRLGLWQNASLQDLPPWLQRERPSILEETRPGE